VKRSGRIVAASAATAGAAALAYAGYAANAWLRYGKPRVKPPSILDRFMPEFEVDERHEIAIDAPAPITYEVACHLDLLRSRIIRSLFAAREAVMRSRPAESRARFRRYWALASAGIVLIRQMTLRLVRDEAERFARVIAA